MRDDEIPQVDEELSDNEVGNEQEQENKFVETNEITDHIKEDQLITQEANTSVPSSASLFCRGFFSAKFCAIFSL